MELTNQTREERPLQKMKRHVPAFQEEASVRCQVRGTEAEVKAKREKTVNTWLAAVIFREKCPGRAYTPRVVVDGRGKGTRRGIQRDGSTFLESLRPCDEERERSEGGGG